MRQCSTCKEWFPLENFHKDQYYCKPCASSRRKLYYKTNKARERVLTDLWRNKNKDTVRSHHLAKYGITQAGYDELRAKQKECCAICERHESQVPRNNRISNVSTALHVDHCHLTGVVRGLLCFNCNALLGKARDDVVVLQRAISYLQEERRKE